MTSASRQEKRQVLLALLGLLFACFSATLMVMYVVPRPTAMTVITLTPDTAMGKMTLQEFESILADSSQMMVRGSRRLMADVNLTPEETETVQNATEITTANSTEPTSAPTSSPSSHPTVIVDEILPLFPEGQPVGGTTDSDTSGTSDTVPAIMLGLASCIIVLAGLLYAHDVRDRFTNTTPDANKPDTDIPEGGSTSAGSTSHAGESGYWINTTSNALVPYPMLPPISPEGSPQQQTDVSISRMSTLTGSMFDTQSQWSFGVEDKLMAIESSSCVTELSEEHLVPQDMSALSTLMKKRKADDDSSLGSMDDDDDEEALLGETCLDTSSNYEPLDSPRPSFEYTPDSTPGKDDRDAVSEGSEDSADERMGGEQFLLPYDAAPSVVRDIYFVPGNITQVKIGLTLEKHAYPTIVHVNPRSPLVGRVFVGDLILSLNDIDGADFTAEECMTILEAGLMVKLTVKSIEYEGASDDGSSVVDLDDLEGAVEV